MTFYSKYLAERLCKHRARRRFTQQQLADKIGVKRPSIGAYEEGRAMPPLPVLLKLAQVFGLTLDQLCQPPNYKVPDKPSPLPCATCKNPVVPLAY